MLIIRKRKIVEKPSRFGFIPHIMKQRSTISQAQTLYSHNTWKGNALAGMESVAYDNDGIHAPSNRNSAAVQPQINGNSAAAQPKSNGNSATAVPQPYVVGDVGSATEGGLGTVMETLPQPEVASDTMGSVESGGQEDDSSSRELVYRM